MGRGICRKGVEASLDILQDAYADKEFTLKVSLTHAADVWASPAGIQQAIQAVLSHSFEAVPIGGRVEVSTRTDGDVVVLSVQDNGSGISADDEAYIFDPLFIGRDHQTKSDTELAIAQKIIHTHAGELRLVQSDNVTCFEIRLSVYKDS